MAPSFDLSDAKTALEQMIASAPAGTNPWLTVQMYLTAQVQWDVDNSFKVQLYILSGVLIVAPLTLICSLWVRWRQGELWLFKIMRGEGGAYIVPHYLTAFSCFIIAFLATLEAFIWMVIAKAEHRVVTAITLWEGLTWIPAWLAFFFASCSLIVTHILHLDSSGRRINSFVTQAWFLNSMMLVIPSALIASVVYLSITANQKYKVASELYPPLAKLVTQVSATWSPEGTGAIDLSLVSSSMGTAQEFLQAVNTFVNRFNLIFYVWVAFVGLLMLLFGAASGLHLRELSRTLQQLDTRSHVSDGARAQEDVIYKTYNTLVKLTVAIFAALALFASMFLFVAASGRKVVTDMHYLEVAHLMPCYAFALLGVPLSIMLFRRALVNSESSPVPSTSPTSTRKAELEMNRVNYSVSPDPLAKEEYASASSEAEYPVQVLPPHSQAPSSNSGYIASSPSTTSLAPFSALQPARVPPAYNSNVVPYHARSPTSTVSSTGWRSPVSTGPAFGGRDSASSRRGLVAAAEPMGERLPNEGAAPSWYATRSAFS